MLLTSDGNTVLTVMLGFSDLQPPFAGPISRYFGQLSATTVAAIEQSNYASGEKVDETDYPNFCMDAVLFNLAQVTGLSRATIEAKASEIRAERRKKLAEEKGVAVSKVKVKPLNSDNLKAATALGGARFLGECERVQTPCQKAIEYAPAKSKHPKADPFAIEDGTRAARIFHPNPETLMLDAVRGAGRGDFLFVGSVVEHHSVSFILRKSVDGPVQLGSKDYKLYWNDQYTDGERHFVNVPPGVRRSDGQTRVQVDDGFGKGLLGQEVKGLELIRKIFYMSSTERSKPELDTFWSDDENRKKFVGASAKTPELKNLAEMQRCRNLAKLQLWHVLQR